MRSFLPLFCLFASVVNATAIVKRSVGASTSLASKSKLCSILDYGGVADGKTDISTAISSAFNKCVSGSAATLYIPEGSYSCTSNICLNLHCMLADSDSSQ